MIFWILNMLGFIKHNRSKCYGLIAICSTVEMIAESMILISIVPAMYACMLILLFLGLGYVQLVTCIWDCI